MCRCWYEAVRRRYEAGFRVQGLIREHRNIHDPGLYGDELNWI